MLNFPIPCSVALHNVHQAGDDIKKAGGTLNLDTLNLDAFHSMSSFQDARLGIRERFVALNAGGASTLGVLSEPLGEVRSPAWVLCHSFGLEQIYLQSIEVPIARKLSAAGFPVLRFHAQGYGDSELPVDQVSLTSHVRDSLDAVGAVRDATGSSQIGLMGARFGGAVAALVADRIEATAMALWDPVVTGKTYLSSLIRQSVMSDLAAEHAGRSLETKEQRERDLTRTGMVDLQGFPVTRDTYDELRALDLVADLQAFKGESLIVQISRSREIKATTSRIVDRLGELGGNSTLETVVNQRAQGFGGPRFRASSDKTIKIDTQIDILKELADLTVSWAQRLSGLSPTTTGEDP